MSDAVLNENLLADPAVRETVREVADMGFSEDLVRKHSFMISLRAKLCLVS